MMRGKIIRQFLIDGTPEGRWCSELSNWTGMILEQSKDHETS